MKIYHWLRSECHPAKNEWINEVLKSDHRRWAQSTLACYANRQVRRIMNLIRMDPIFSNIYPIQGRLEWKVELWACKQYTIWYWHLKAGKTRDASLNRTMFLCDFVLCPHHLHRHSNFIFLNFKCAFTVLTQSRIGGIEDVKTTSFWKFNLVIHMARSLNCIDACCHFWSCSMDNINSNENWHNNWYKKKKGSIYYVPGHAFL